jgi:hypothetical protein
LVVVVLLFCARRQCEVTCCYWCDNARRLPDTGSDQLTWYARMH